MSGISILALALTQVDKVVLSKVLTLEAFGYYTVASTVASSLYRLIGPIFAAFFPRFSQLVGEGNETSLAQLYHGGCQLMAVVLLPVAFILALFAQDVLQLWTRNEVLARHTFLILALLSIGTALNGLMNLPYALQLAYGWTRLAFYTNLVAVIVLVPPLVWAASRYGGVGAAAIWVVLNLGYVLVTAQIMHRRLLRGEKWKWYAQDLALPLVAAAVVAGLGRALIPSCCVSQPVLVGGIAAVSAATLAAAVLAAPRVRRQLLTVVM
jgi:O-antigen/teichoic acid export membrane protein